MQSGGHKEVATAVQHSTEAEREHRGKTPQSHLLIVCHFSLICQIPVKSRVQSSSGDATHTYSPQATQKEREGYAEGASRELSYS